MLEVGEVVRVRVSASERACAYMISYACEVISWENQVEMVSHTMATASMAMVMASDVTTAGEVTTTSKATSEVTTNSEVEMRGKVGKVTSLAELAPASVMVKVTFPMLQPVQVS